MLLVSRSYRDLRADGLTRAAIERLVNEGHPVRARRGVYLPRAVPELLLRAVQLGGRLDCVSLLAQSGVFVYDSSRLHVQVDRKASRLPARGAHVRAHWRTSSAAPRDAHTPLVEAIVQSASCQSARHLIATIDSAWHQRLIDEEQVGDIFSRLPRRFRRLRRLVNPSAESGPETLVRLMLRSVGLRYRTQVLLAGVGRVDFLVEGWLIIECDSKAHHSSWEAQREDRRRDRAAASAGYVTLRLLAEEILYAPDIVRAALAGVRARVRRTARENPAA